LLATALILRVISAAYVGLTTPPLLANPGYRVFLTATSPTLGNADPLMLAAWGSAPPASPDCPHQPRTALPGCGTFLAPGYKRTLAG
jgi:hypothetical protein